MLTILAITMLCQHIVVDKIVDILTFILTFVAKNLSTNQIFNLNLFRNLSVSTWWTGRDLHARFDRHLILSCYQIYPKIYLAVIIRNLFYSKTIL
jgi:hypothetical protein